MLSKINSVRPAWWLRIRYQLGLGLLISVLVPYAVRTGFSKSAIESNALNNSLIVSVCCMIVGYYVIRMLYRLPGTRTYYNILPTFAAAYSVGLLTILFVRLDYSLYMLSTSFILCNVWYHFLMFRLRRLHVPVIGVVPIGDVGRLQGLGSVQWMTLSDPFDRLLRYDAIVADLRADMPEAWDRFLADEALAGTLVMHVKQLEESLSGRVAIEHLAENTLGSLMPGIIYGKMKRIAELLLSIVAIPLFLPLMMIVAVLIKLDSKGPVLFTQERMGYRGRPFRIYKFRSMSNARPASEGHAAAITEAGDRRITRVGKHIRRFRIDELPQVFNVLKGDMSWIGPRPEAELLSVWYEVELPFYRYRHIVRPGITGWAQVNQGHVAELADVHWKLQYDFFYIKNFSFWLDVLILARTVRIILGGFGAR